MITDSFGIDKFFSLVGRRRSSQLADVVNAQRAELLGINFWNQHRERVASVAFPTRDGTHRTYGDTVTIDGEWPRPLDKAHFEAILYDLRPWRKGPFSLMGIEVDTEWKSYWKWNRILPHLPPLRDAVIGDIGCNDGYYMFRLLEHAPKAVLGLDPNARFYFQFDLLHRLFQPSELFFEPLGVEHAVHLEGVFDMIFCLGVIYHRRDPHGMLRDLHAALKMDGVLFIEGLTVPSDFSDCLIPESRYAMMRNVWAVPSPETLRLWVERVGFRKVEIIDTSITTVDEQRKTTFAHFDSLEDFLDPNDATKTIEGYPAPRRTIIKAIR